MQKDDQIFVATGFKKWGMTTATMAALLLKDLILERESPYTLLFHPKRQRVVPQLKNLIRYNAKNAFELIKGKLKSVDEIGRLLPGEAITVKTEDGKYGIYKDNQNELWMVDITCPHLGCELSFNRAEQTWDCPCHDSRFKVTGEVVSGPAHCSLKPTKNHIHPNLF